MAISLFKPAVRSYKAPMAMQDDQTGSEEAAGRQFVRQFDTDRGRALAQFCKLLPQKTQAGKLLQQLNKLDRYDIVLAATDDLPLDAGTAEFVIVERARALASTGALPLAEQLLERMAATRRNDYAFNYNAGRVLSDARLFAKALDYYEVAFHAKPTPLVAERIFVVHMVLQQYDQATAAMGRVIRIGSYREALARDFAFLLRQIAPGALDPELAFAIASLPAGDEDLVAPALVPHLVAADLMDSVLAIVDRCAAKVAGWDDEVLSSLVPYLEQRGKIDHLMRVYELSGGFPDSMREKFARLFVDAPAERLTALQIPDVADFLTQSEQARAYHEASERFSRTADAEAALKMLQLLPFLISEEQTERFYAREKRALGRLAATVADRLGARDDVADIFAAFVVRWVNPRCAQFFRSQDAAELAAAIAAAKRMEAAPRNSKAGLLREDYFRFYIERRSFLQMESLENDFELCNVVLNYFSFAVSQRAAAATPVGAELAARLGRTALSFGGGKPLDVLTSFVMMQERPHFSAEQSPKYDEFCWWYLTRFSDARKVPYSCLRPEIVAYLNRADANDESFGVPITRFLRITWRESREARKAFDLDNFIDRILFVLDRLQSSLPSRTQHLPFYEPFISNRGGILSRVLAMLDGTTAKLTDAAKGTVSFPAVHLPGAPQDILLVGHASKETGLGRNFAMLKNALTAAGASVGSVDFDANAETANAQLMRWRDGCRTPPIAVFAVNAHDVPDFYLKDRSGVLLDCYAAGFFLWEVSKAPPVQQLGIALVDEIWTPTAYVASVYAPLKPTHVVGKGLFRGDESFLNARRQPIKNSAFTFVTVFDFDSSIERKNPLATVLAFQEAFRASEKVRLIVKTSNVNPRHWSNASRHWENLISSTLGDNRIKIITQRYSNDEMTALVRDADCVVSLHRSEGFGYLVADAMAFGTPVIATDYSGNADFCTPDTSYPVSCKLIDVPNGAMRWRCEGALWADPDVAAAAAQMRAVVENQEAAAAKAERARQNIKSKYATQSFATALRARIDAIRAAGTRGGPAGSINVSEGVARAAIFRD